MENINYQKELEKIINENIKNNIKPKLLLHSCCAPCSSYVLDYLSEFFEITVYFYNPNIYPEEEFEYRKKEQEKFIKEYNFKSKINFVDCSYDEKDFYEAIKGFENCAEGRERCFICYKLRLEKTIKYACEQEKFDYFTTTLSISPHKNAKVLNEIGYELSSKYGVKNLPSDFKKKNGFKISVEISNKFNMYRQDYCGCVFSKNKNKSEEV